MQKFNMNHWSKPYKTSRLLVVFLTVFVLKFLILNYYHYLTECSHPERILSGLSISSGDTWSYIEPIKNYISEGEYFVERFETKFYSIRPPHYGLIYLAFSQLFSDDASIFNAIVVTKVFFDTLSIVLLSILTYNLTRQNMWVFWGSLVLWTFTVNVSHFAQYIYPESIAISFLSFSVYYLYRYIFSSRPIFIFIAGITASVSIVLRPYSMLFLVGILMVIFIKYFSTERNYKQLINHSAVFAVSVLLVVGPWTVRNYRIYGEIIPYSYKILEAYYGVNYLQSAEWAKRKYIEAIGEADMHWDYSSAASYFMPDSSIFKTKSEYEFPDYVFTRHYGLEEIDSARTLLLQAKASNSEEDNELAVLYFNKLENAFIAENYWFYRIIVPLKNAKQMIIHSGSYYLPVSSSFECYHFYQMFFKLFESAVYYFSLFFGVIGLIVISCQKKESLVFLLIPVSIIITASFMLSHGEQRYFHVAFPILMLHAIYCTWYIYHKIKLSFK